MSRRRTEKGDEFKTAVEKAFKVKRKAVPEARIAPG